MKADPPVARLRFDCFELDEAEARLTCAGEPVALAPKPFAVLCALAHTPGSLATKNALLDLVWGHRFVTESVLKTAISELSEVCRQHTEAIVSQHVHELFQRLPMLSGFWLRSDLNVVAARCAFCQRIA
jgi:DNA-binding response OmpR family regulator